jgi:GH25 family lysozyme M1 (1,4-beta-N-acetylmuramidase)
MAFGVAGVVHKATEAIYPDPAYNRRRKAALAAGVPCWGAYLFNGDTNKYNVMEQAKAFLKAATPDANTLCAIDFEPTTKGRELMSIHECISLMKIVEQSIGRQVVFYSYYSYIVEHTNQLSSDEFDYLRSRKLWLADYRKKSTLPKGWDKCFLWQFAADDNPNGIPGINNGKASDQSIYFGTKDELIKNWIV